MLKPFNIKIVIYVNELKYDSWEMNRFRMIKRKKSKKIFIARNFYFNKNSYILDVYFNISRTNPKK